MTLIEYGGPDAVRAQVSSAHPRRNDWKQTVVFCLAFGSAETILFSIALSQILLGMGLVAMALWRRPIHLPDFIVPVALFFALTLVAIAGSDDPSGGLVQLRKFYVFGMVPLMYNTFRNSAQVRRLLWAWSALAGLSAVVAIGQSYVRWREAIQVNAPLYEFILDDRSTGLLSHWMTYGGVQMMVLLMLLAFLIFGQPGRWGLPGWLCAGGIWLSLVLSLTRSVFLLGVPAGMAVLLWKFRPWLAILAPVAVLVICLASPLPVRERILSVLIPHGDVDSNSRRMIMVRTGLRMIRAHPWLGIGPEQVDPQFERYLPPSVHEPLPKGWYGHLHNLYLQYAAERGIPALICILWMIAMIVAAMRRASLRLKANRWIFHGVLACVAAILVEGLFEYNLGDSEVLTVFLAVVSCGYGVTLGDETELPRPIGRA